jgi:nucleotide-binding universal stress UspA family protein
MLSKILVPIDPEHGAYVDEVLRIAAELATAHDARVELLTIIPAGPVIVSQFLPESYETMASKRAEEELAALVARMGAAAERAHAEKIGADLIVIGSHKPDVTDYLLGSTAARVVRHANCSVYVVR